MSNIMPAAMPVTEGSVAGIPRVSKASWSVQKFGGRLSGFAHVPTASEIAIVFKSTPEPAGPVPYKVMTGGAPHSGKVTPGTQLGSLGLHCARSVLPLESWAYIRFTPWRPGLQLMIPEAELPAPVPTPWTKVHGR